jgi:hypothetical protein
MELYPIAVGLEAFALFALLHVVIWHFRLAGNRGVFLIVKVAIVCYPATAVLNWWLADITWSSLVWVSAPVFMFMIMAYLHLYVGVDKSVSIRILGELITEGRDRMPLEELDRIYPAASMVEPRLEVLVEKKWLGKNGEKYFCDSRGRQIGRFALWLKKIYALETTG